MVEYTLDGKEYKYIPYEELKEEDLPRGHYRRGDYFDKRNRERFYKQSASDNKYVHFGCGFDIETTKIPKEKVNINMIRIPNRELGVKTISEYIDQKEFSIMYVWQFAIDEVTIIGRTMEEFKELLQRLNKYYMLDERHKLLVYIHNMKFEFSFIKNQLNWKMKEIKKDGIVVDTRPDIFSTDGRTIIKGMTEEYVEFRDSYILTQTSLAKMAEDYELGIEKLKGELDYSLIRHNKTQLSNRELAYCINDVQILVQFYHKYIYKYFILQGKKIPLTMTGILRDELKEAIHKLPKYERKKYYARIMECLPDDYSTYCIWMEDEVKLFRGGYNHANKYYSNKIISIDAEEYYLHSEMGSQDFKSSYPAVMLQKKFPWKFSAVETDYFYSFTRNRKWLEDYAYWGRFTIKNITPKLAHSIESKDKLLEYSSDAVFDNGRLVSASWVRTYLTEQDVLNYLDFYNVDDLENQWECEVLYFSKKEPLPKVLKDMVLKYFALKETLQKGTIEYAIAKSKLNSLYGMCVTAMMHKDLRFNVEEGVFETGNCAKLYADACKGTFLLPQWGIWITAFARRRLLHTFAKMDSQYQSQKEKDKSGGLGDAIYGDTDSIKYKDIIGNQWIFDTYNDNIRRINKTMYVGKYDRKLFEKIGTFDYEGKMYRFKTLGCKRYIHTDIAYNKKTKMYYLDVESTVAGMTKGSLVKYCEKINNLKKDDEPKVNPYDIFQDNMKLSKEDADKLTCVYTEGEFECELTDYQGNTTMVGEKSCCTLVDIEFTLSMKLYIDYLIIINKDIQVRGRRL